MRAVRTVILVLATITMAQWTGTLLSPLFGQDPSGRLPHQARWLLRTLTQLVIVLLGLRLVTGTEGIRALTTQLGLTGSPIDGLRFGVIASIPMFLVYGAAAGGRWNFSWEGFLFGASLCRRFSVTLGRFACVGPTRCSA